MELRKVQRTVWNEDLGWYEKREIETGKYKFTEEDKIPFSLFVGKGRLEA